MPLPIVVGIDFGTTRSAWAYKVNGQAGDKIMVRIPDATRQSGSSSVKTETAVLMKDGGKGRLIKYGETAHEEFIKLQQDDNLNGEAFFRWFKLALCGETRFTCIDEPKVTSPGDHEVPLINVMKAALGYFKDDALKFLSATTGRRISAEDVNWVLTVPAIYDQFAKSFMRHAAHEAGMIKYVNSGKLRLCLEPEAACLAVTSKDGDHPLTVESEGKNIMIVDCGGGTIDITTHKVVQANPLKLVEAAAPKGGAWGSTFVDSAFEGWLKLFLGDEMFAQIKGTAIFLSIMEIWERKKAEFQGLDSGAVRLNLSDLAQDSIGVRDIEERRNIYNASRAKSDRVGGKKFNIDLPATLVNSFFAPTINKITDCLRGIKQSSKLGNFHRVFLVGGFSRCPMLQEAARKVLQKNGCFVVTAHEPDILIVKGAVAFFNTSGVFTSRTARLTYGISTSFEFDSTNAEHRRRHAANGTFKDSDGRTLVNDCFSHHVTIGQDIRLDGIFPKKSYCPTTEEQTAISFAIYASEKKDPQFTDEDGCFEIGKGCVDLDMDVPRKDRGVSVKFTYGDTELLVDFFHIQTGAHLKGGLSLVSRSS